MTDIKRWLTQVLEVLLLVVAILTILQVLFGQDVTKLFGMDVIANIGNLARQFGNAGLVGVVAVSVVAYLLYRSRPFAGGGPR